MIEVQCPRCLQYWYSKEEVTGRRARLCPACVGKRRGILQRGAGPFGGAAQLGVFAVVAAALLVVDGVWIVLAACWPDVFGAVMLIYGGVLLLPSALWFAAVLRIVRWGWEMDWTIHRWPMLIGLMGLACVLAYFSLRRSP
jgi:hypothetical protein